MDKKSAFDFFGSPRETADAVSISIHAVAQWPDPLPRRIADRVIAAAVRKGRVVPADWLKDSVDSAEDEAKAA